VSPAVHRVTAAVLTWNRREEAQRTVERLLASPERPPVIVVDNGSTDGTVAALRERFPTVDVVALAVNAGAAGRNIALARARTPYVAFCDDDTWWAPGAIARGTALLDAHPQFAVVTGRVLVGPAERVDRACLEMAESPLPREPGLPGVLVLGFLAGAAIVRREAVLAAGGFEPRLFLGGEEELLAVDLAAAGWKLAYADEVVVHHHPSPRRDAGSRRRVIARNAIWVAWLRRPLASALRVTGRRVWAARRDREALRGCLEALAGAPWVMRQRRVMPADVERAFATLDGARTTGERRGLAPGSHLTARPAGPSSASLTR
jgi:GT2 family glycosyltransferase